MSTIYVQTNKQDLFSYPNSFYAEAKVEITPNHQTGQFTVSIKGVRGYYYAPGNTSGYNFRQYINVWLDTNNKSNSTTRVSGSTEISASGSNTYTGYMPKLNNGNAVYQSLNCTKTFNYNADGTVPDVYIHIKSYNDNVKWLSHGVYVKANTNITTKINNKVPLRDIRVPTFTINQTKVELTKIGVSTTPTGGFTFDSWQVQLCNDDDTKKVGPITYNEATLSKEYTVIRPSQIVWIRGRNAYNHIWSQWKSTTFDCNQPAISNASLTPKSNNKAVLSFNSNYDVYYKISCTSPKIDTGWLGPVNANTSPNAEITVADNKNINYTLNIKRRSNANLYNSTTVNCNTILPKLTISNLTISGTNVSFDVESDTNCNEWTVTFSNSDGGYNPIEKIKDVNTKKIHVDVTGIGININYTIKVTGVSVLNGLTGTAYEYGVKSIGAINIGDKLASVYIYNSTSKHWQGAVPLIYIDGKDQVTFPDYEAGWYMCGLNKEKFKI